MLVHLYAGRFSLHNAKDNTVARAKRKSVRASKKMTASYTAILYSLREGVLILAVAISVFLLIALATYHRMDPGWSNATVSYHIDNATGRVGAYLADLTLSILGYLAYLFPVLMCYLAWVLYRYKHSPDLSSPFKLFHFVVKMLGVVVTVFFGAALLDMYVYPNPRLLPYHAGGMVGAFVSVHLIPAFNQVGATIVSVACFLIGMTLITGMSWTKMLEAVGATVMRMIDRVWTTVCEFEFRYYLDSVTARFTQVMSAMQSVKERCHTLLTRLRKSSQLEASNGSDDYAEVTVSRRRGKEEEVDLASAMLASAEVAMPEARPIKSPTRKIKVPRYSRSKAMPALSLLDAYAQKSTSNNSSAQRKDDVEQCLLDFGVKVKVANILPGPVVTRYELQLAAGTKASKITGLAKDLARSLSVSSVRVVEVIPGKSVVGLELPNKKRETVGLQEVLNSKPYSGFRSALPLALGNDIAGHPVVVDLGKMPHLLVAGTTGSGKSVCLNALLLSLLYKSSPEELRLILIDPKMLELSVYDDIPHLLTPVVTDMKDASTALRWCVAEMERRYRLMASLGVRNIAGYNEKVRAALKRGAPLLDPLAVEDARELQILPNIVVITDEFADMMVVVGKKVETLIARLAQKARAAGIHLVLATQRPSVDVITGLIKANIPTRIAFQVSSKIDSRTILDQQGAEQLLGHGDMLYLPPGSGVPVRVHGAFVSDDEVHRVVEHLKKQAKPEYLEDILDETSSTDPTGYTTSAMATDDGEQDELYDEAVAFVAQSRRVSVSSIQRRFKIGYNRAARIVETMEAAKVVSPVEGYGARQVLVPPPE